jgi:uncharacterized protein (DUF1501 family)
MQTNKQRRDFLKLSAVATLYSFTSSTLVAQEPIDSGYKAIVVLYQAGGNDALNMFIPSSDNPKTGYSNYIKIRENIGVKNTNLPLSEDGNEQLDLSSANPYAINNSLSQAYTKGFYRHSDTNGDDLGIATNALMPELAHLINKGKVAIIQNCGNLIEPATKEEFYAKTKPTPPFLFAHNHQTKLTFNGEASKLDYTGWAGRIFDRYKTLNNGDIYGMNISVGGVTHLFDGKSTAPLLIRPSGPSKYYRINETLYEESMQLPRREMFTKLYNKIRIHSFAMQNTIVDDWQNNAPDFSTLTNAYGEELFSHPSNATLSQSSPTFADTSVLKQLEAVAKLAKIGKDRGLKREIFYVFDGGYDTHNNQSQQHAKKLRGLSLGLGDFYRALTFLGMENEVTLLTCSDFGRSTGDNGDGTDHAWGSSYFALGGAVQGGVYGKAPDLTLGSEDDYTHKGRLIPTTSNSQYFATVAKWFGLDENTLDTIFPELHNFSQKDLGFMA